MNFRSFWFLLFMLVPIFAQAIPSQPLSIEEHNKLVPWRLCLDNVGMMPKNVIDTPTKYDAAIAVCLAKAKEVLGRDISYADLMEKVKPTYELTVMAKAAGWLDGVGWMKVLFTIGIAIFGCIFVAKTLPLWLSLPMVVYETALYGTAIGLSIWGLSLHANNAIWGLLGTLLFIGALMFTVNSRHLKGNGSGFFAVIMIYAAVFTFLYQSTLIGYVAVGALMCMAGFAARAFGLGFAIGFEDEKSVSIGTTVAFLVLGVYVLMRITHADQPYIQVFAPAAYWLGSFVGYLGLLIMASRWYSGRSLGGYMGMNLIVMPVAGVAAIMIGSTYGIPELQKIGGTFFLLWLVEKYVEWTFRDLVSVSVFGLIASVGGFMLMNWLSAHAEKVGPFLFFLS